MKLAKKMVEAAAGAGSAYVKFQSWSVKTLKPGPWDQDGRREIYEKAELTADQHMELQQFCDGLKIRFLSSAFSVAGIRLLYGIGCNAVKIASTETANRPLLEAAAESFDRVFMSTGASTFPEIEAALDILKNQEVILMHCVSSYPCPPANVNLPRIARLKEAFARPNVRFGYSGHGQGVHDAMAALEYGIDFIEKHFTTDNNLPGRDNKFALLPWEMKRLTNYIADREAMRAEHPGDYQECEAEARATYRGRWDESV